MNNLVKTLTPRERQLATLVAQGLGNKHIAQQLHISEGSVKTYLNRIYTKLGINNRLALSQLLRTQGVV